MGKSRDKTHNFSPSGRYIRILLPVTGIVVIISLLLSLCLYIPTLAYLTDSQLKSAAAQAGTVQLGAPNLSFAQVDPDTGEPIVFGDPPTAWEPGDIHMILWDINNLGNKSVDLRYTVRIYWDEGSGMAATDNETQGSPLWAESPYLYLYPATMSDGDIRADMDSGAPDQFIDIGGSDVKYANASGSTRYGYSYAFAGATLDGAGQNAETGDADVSGATSDTVAFKLALSSNAPAGFMDRKLVFDLTVEAKQHRNTNDGNWSLIETQANR